MAESWQNTHLKERLPDAPQGDIKHGTWQTKTQTKDTNQKYMTKTNKGIEEKTITGSGWNNKNNKHGRGGGGITEGVVQGGWVCWGS